MNNFLRLVGKSDAARHGPVYSDSDVYKWTEAVGFALQSGDRPELRADRRDHQGSCRGSGAERVFEYVLRRREDEGSHAA